MQTFAEPFRARMSASGLEFTSMNAHRLFQKFRFDMQLSAWVIVHLLKRLGRADTLSNGCRADDIGRIYLLFKTAAKEDDHDQQARQVKDDVLALLYRLDDVALTVAMF